MTDQGRILQEIFESLDQSARDALLAYAEFLVARGAAGVSPAEPVAAAAARKPPAGPAAEPVAIPRPEKEAVVAAIKRLRKTYPMLDRNQMLNEVYTLMNQHMLKERPAKEVIDDLEAVFEQSYRTWVSGNGDAP